MSGPRPTAPGAGGDVGAAPGGGIGPLGLPAGPTGGIRVLFRDQRVDLALLSLGALLQVGGQLGVPLAFGAAVNDMTAGDESQLLLYTALIAVLGTAIAAGSGVSTLAASRLGLSVERRLRNRLFRQLMRLDLGLLRRFGAGELITRLIFSTQSINPGVIQSLPLAIKELLYFVIAGAIMLILSPPLAALSLWPLPLIAYFSWRYNSRARPIMLAVQETTGALTSELDRVLDAEATTQAFNRQSAVAKRIGQRIETEFDRESSLRLVNAIYYPILSTLPELGRLALYLVGGILVVDGQISLGTFVVFVSYLSLVLMAVENLATRVTAAAQVETTLSLYDELLEHEPEAPGTPADPGPRPRIALRDCRWGYAPARPVLRDLDLDLPGGEWTAVVGPSGAGKTTLLRLLGGFVDTTRLQGEALLGDLSLSELGPGALWSQVAYEDDEPKLPARSVGENVAYGRPEAGAERIEAAIEAVAAGELLGRLPRGLDTVIGEEVSLTPVERRQLALARAVCARPRLLLLDNALDHLPPDVRSAALARLRSACEQATVLVATSRAELASGADRLVVIEDGRITGAGTPDELAERGGFAGRLLARSGGGPR